MKSGGDSYRAAQDALNEVFATIEMALPSGTSKDDVGKVRERFGPAIAAELERLMLRNMLTSERLTPAPEGYSLFLRAVPNLDFAPETHQATVDVPGRWILVDSIADARMKALDFIRAWDLGGGNWSGGEIARDGKVFARVSYNGRIWDTATEREIALADGGTKSPAKRSKRARTERAATPSAKPPLAKPISFSTRRQKIRPEIKRAIDDEIEKLSPGQRPDSFVKDWPGLTTAGVKTALLAAGRKKLGAVVELRQLAYLIANGFWDRITADELKPTLERALRISQEAVEWLVNWLRFYRLDLMPSLRQAAIELDASRAPQVINEEEELERIDAEWSEFAPKLTAKMLRKLLKTAAAKRVVPTVIERIRQHRPDLLSVIEKWRERKRQ